jgi:ArsR family transcriptional regulator
LAIMSGGGIDGGLRLGLLCKALGHPARVTIIRLLSGRRGGASCGDIVKQLPLAQSTVSRHLLVLRQAGFLVSEGIPPRVVYRLDQPALDAFKRAVSAL